MYIGQSNALWTAQSGAITRAQTYFRKEGVGSGVRWLQDYIIVYYCHYNTGRRYCPENTSTVGSVCVCGYRSLTVIPRSKAMFGGFAGASLIWVCDFLISTSPRAKPDKNRIDIFFSNDLYRFILFIDNTI